jgi:hypothetical protein
MRSSQVVPATEVMPIFDFFVGPEDVAELLDIGD